MKKPQALNFWHELHNSTEKDGVYSKFKNKSGYGGLRTLIRYTQLDDGLRQGLPLAELAKSTGWSESLLVKVSQWWNEEFGGKSPANEAKDPSTLVHLPPANAPGENAPRRQKHTQMLLAPLDTLTGIEPFPLYYPDLLHFYLKPQVPSWPVPKGRVRRDDLGQLSVHLTCEHDCQISCEDDFRWLCLSQHLENGPLAGAIVTSKEALARAVADWLKLLAVLQQRAEQPESAGGTGLALVPDMSYPGNTSHLGYGPYFLFTILHQGLSRALKLPLQPKQKEEFQLRLPDTIELGGYPVIQAAEPGVRERAIEWLLRLQDEVTEWRETRAAAASYSASQSACRNVQRQLQRLQLQAGLPTGSSCEVCRDWNL